jgi:hypothetical protein
VWTLYNGVKPMNRSDKVDGKLAYTFSVDRRDYKNVWVRWLVLILWINVDPFNGAPALASGTLIQDIPTRCFVVFAVNRA